MKTSAVQSGFTLLEMLLAVSLFSITAVVGVGAIVSAQAAFANNRAEALAITSLNSVLTTITDEMRVGTDFFCNTDGGCSAPVGSTLSFVNNSGNVISYTVVSESHGGEIRRSDSSVASEAFFPISSTDVDITSMFTRGGGIDDGDNEQPFAVILLTGSYAKDKTTNSVKLEAMVTQRNLDAE